MVQSLGPDGITGVVLAGGRATRMGGEDKGLRLLDGRPMAGYVMDALRPQVEALVVNANRNRDAYEALGAPVVADRYPDFPGPLAGMASALHAAATPWVVTAPCDSPLVPHDLVARLVAARDATGADLAVAEGEGRLQPVFALLPRRLLGDLDGYLEEGGRKIDRWYARHTMAVADLGDCPEAFLNINTPEEHAMLEKRLRERAYSRGGQ